MTKITIIAGALGLAVLAGSVLADEMATPAEAQALSRKAQAAVNEMGKEKAFAVFADPKGGYRIKDLYVFCMSLQGVMLSHPLKPELIGQNQLEFDKYGDKLFKRMIATVKKQGEGWVDYQWPHPGTGEIRDKTSYVVSNQGGFFCGVGAYK
jgi:cytochrome c